MPDGLRGLLIDRESRAQGQVDFIDFLFWNPVTNQVAATYDEAVVRGRSEPHAFYLSTGEDTYQFDIRLVTSAFQGDGGTSRLAYYKYLFLKSFQYPDYGEGKVGPVRPPRTAILVIGKFLRMKGIIKDPSFTFHKPYDLDGYPQIIDCTFTFRQVNNRPKDFRDIRNNIPSGALRVT